MHDWQVNLKNAFMRSQCRVGLCPKMKNHPLCGWIIISQKVPSSPNPYALTTQVPIKADNVSSDTLFELKSK